jgi:predicted NAD/FAD-dependent oxidoreductase
MTTNRPHIAVIGAGLAGLSCARQLQETGYMVTVFDSGAQPGGRMGTRRGQGWQCDHGAQYFTARDPAFSEEVARWEAAGVAGLWEPRLAVIGGNAPALEQRSTARFVGVPRMNAPASWLATGLVIRNRVTIRHMRHDDAGWRLRSDEHGLHPEHYDAVLFAVPPQQAAELLEPLLPLTAQLASEAVMQPCWSVTLRLAQRHAPGYDAAFVNEGPLRWLARDSSKPGREGGEVWVAQASPEWSAAHIDTPDSEVAASLVAAFRALGGPAPGAVSVHRWLYAKAAVGSSRRAVWIPAVRVGLCGDWLLGGRVEDAWLSGRALASSVAASVPLCFGEPCSSAR